MATKVFFLMRLNDHIQYLKNIEATLEKKGNFQGTDHHYCKLGQWLYGDGVNEVIALQNNKAQEVFDSLFEPHKRFHTVSKQVLEKKQAGDEKGIQIAITEMYKISDVITQKLLDLDALA
ncbi:CZB domain-containing protein [Candidatus Parabeggiatoa sp. HSG14]|uniref:CZB domain-containing protein n=1 Tax=Candidatus Parabeggiatoa sp. HSG14 TaxID=3055593 RepID=UPI0025A6F88C|nr:CZB domain-containing protein [Thiotrichales bacterium HSG14]